MQTRPSTEELQNHLKKLLKEKQTKVREQDIAMRDYLEIGRCISDLDNEIIDIRAVLNGRN